MADWSPIYKTGTATVGAGSTAVTGQGSNWSTAGLRPGDQFRAAGLSVSIASINSNTSLTLASAWPGAARTTAEYEILRVSDADRLIAAHADLMAVLVPNLSAIGALTGAANKLPYFTGAGQFGLTDLTALGRSLLAATTADGARNALGLPLTTGTWTPVLTALSTPPTVNYTTQYGVYTKIGPLVYLVFNLQLDVSAVGSGSLQINGNPFSSNTSGSRPGVLGLTTAMAPGSFGPRFDIGSNGAIRFITGDGAVANAATLLRVLNGGYISGSAIFTTNM